MAELGTIRKGPKPTDIAVAMPSGWIHLRDGRRLTEEQVADWVELRPVGEQGPRYVTVTPEQLRPDEIRLAMLVAWEKHGQLTIAEAARLSGTANLPNYTSRFATNMIRDGWIRAVVFNGEVVKNGHSKVFEITELGRTQIEEKP